MSSPHHDLCDPDLDPEDQEDSWGWLLLLLLTAVILVPLAGTRQIGRRLFWTRAWKRVRRVGKWVLEEL